MCDTQDVTAVDLLITASAVLTSKSSWPEKRGMIRIQPDGSGGMLIVLDGKEWFLAFDWRPSA